MISHQQFCSFDSLIMDREFVCMYACVCVCVSMSVSFHLTTITSPFYFYRKSQFQLRYLFILSFYT